MKALNSCFYLRSRVYILPMAQIPLGPKHIMQAGPGGGLHRQHSGKKTCEVLRYVPMWIGWGGRAQRDTCTCYGSTGGSSFVPNSLPINILRFCIRLKDRSSPSCLVCTKKKYQAFMHINPSLIYNCQHQQRQRFIPRSQRPGVIPIAKPPMRTAFCAAAAFPTLDIVNSQFNNSQVHLHRYKIFFHVDIPRSSGPRSLYSTVVDASLLPLPLRILKKLNALLARLLVELGLLSTGDVTSLIGST